MAGALVAGLVLDGRYRLEHVLGEGGMGVVWAAAQLGGGPRRAIKLVKEDAEDPDALKRFGHEARSASAVRHPHVVEIIEVLELNRKTPPDAAATLHALLEREATPRGRAALAASESCLRGAAEPRAARELAIIAVQSRKATAEPSSGRTRACSAATSRRASTSSTWAAATATTTRRASTSERR